MDQRSFSLNAEVNAFVMDQDFSTEIRSHFMNDLKDSYKVTSRMLDERKWHVKVLCSIARLLAPIL